MKKSLGVLTLALVCVAVLGVLVRAAGLPLWAYGYTAPPPPGGSGLTCTAARPFGCARGAPPPDDGIVRHLPDSSGGFTLRQIANDYGPADWYPGDHPPMPDIVAHGREAIGLRACGLCHYPNGKGKPENSPVAGEPVSYLIQQMEDFRNGARRTADPNKANGFEMIAIAQALTDAETKTASEYFASTKFTTWIKVVETETVPKFVPTLNGLFQQAEGAATEPLGRRLIELPDKRDDTFLLRNPRSGFTAYVPVGSIAKGEALVTTGGGGKTVRCGICHGPDLKGLGPVPAIAGRQASYVVRQLYDMQQGTRKGVWAALMKAAVANLSEEEMLQIAAYTASRVP